MAAFKCNEAANDQLIRLFVLGNGLRVEELYLYIRAESLTVIVFVRIQRLISYIGSKLEFQSKLLLRFVHFHIQLLMREIK